MAHQKVLITGAYGLIGGTVYKRLAGQEEAYDVYALSRRRHRSVRVLEGQAPDIPEDRLRLADVSDFARVQQAVRGMDAVVHMAADPNGRSSWDNILASNVVGAYNVLEACRQAEIRRVVMASTVQVVYGYWSEEPYKSILHGRYENVPDDIPMVTHETPTRPLNLYASSKVWAEALAHMYVHKYGMSCICLRIGWVLAEDRPHNLEARSVWCSQRDIAQLVQRCVDAPASVRFDIFYGVSDNRYRWMDIEHAREVVGYEPQDRAEDYDL